MPGEAVINTVEIERDDQGAYKSVTVGFGPHYFVEIMVEDGRVNCYIGATHHGIKADASEIDGELERFVRELMDRHPENAF